MAIHDTKKNNNNFDMFRGRFSGHGVVLAVHKMCEDKVKRIQWVQYDGDKNT